MKKFVILLVLAAIVVFAATKINNPLNLAKQQQDVATHNEQNIGGSFELIDKNGKTVKDEDFNGRLMLIYFGFSYCHGICPTDLAVMSEVMSGLNEDERQQVAPIFISVDYERDTPARLLEYMDRYHDSITALTGTQEQVQQAIQAYRVYARKTQISPKMQEVMGPYGYDHSSFTYLMDRQGKYITHFTHDSEPLEVIAKIRHHL